MIEKAMAALASGSSDMTIPGLVDRLEGEMLKEDQAECPVYHHFSPGLYVREVNLPAGILAIGHKQKTEHLNIFLKGRVTILNDDGTTTEMKAPMLFTGKPGRKFGYIHEDVVWLNVYPTDETDIETLEKTYLDKSPVFMDSLPEQLERVADKEDYKSVLQEYRFDEETVRSQSEEESDQVPFPPGSYPVAVFDSEIEGKGLFATASFSEGGVICPARVDGYRTPAGRYTNHAAKPNATMEKQGDTVYLVALSSIKGNCGGQKGEEITINYRDALNIREEESTCQA